LLEKNYASFRLFTRLPFFMVFRLIARRPASFFGHDSHSDLLPSLTPLPSASFLRLNAESRTLRIMGPLLRAAVREHMAIRKFPVPHDRIFAGKPRRDLRSLLCSPEECFGKFHRVPTPLPSIALRPTYSRELFWAESPFFPSPGQAARRSGPKQLFPKSYKSFKVGAFRNGRLFQNTLPADGILFFHPRRFWTRGPFDCWGFATGNFQSEDLLLESGRAPSPPRFFRLFIVLSPRPSFSRRRLATPFDSDLQSSPIGCQFFD